MSPTYARELLTPDFGMGLDGLLQSREDDLCGILNGIDTEVWNPETDPALVQPFSARSLKHRCANREWLEQHFEIEPDPESPLFCVISRLTTQKGLDLLLEAIPSLVHRGARLIVLGSGDKKLEISYKAMASQFPQSIGVEIGYNEDLAHKMQGGSDAILIHVAL